MSERDREQALLGEQLEPFKVIDVGATGEPCQALCEHSRGELAVAELAEADDLAAEADRCARAADPLLYVHCVGEDIHA